jgi:ubiquinone/menaquinone biosynthesis C-methylase UbiE
MGSDNAQFDLIMAYNVLMDVEDIPGALKEIRRVMRPMGRLIISVGHPFADRDKLPHRGCRHLFRQAFR